MMADDFTTVRKEDTELWNSQILWPEAELE